MSAARNLYQMLAILALINGIVYAQSANSEPEWNLIEEYGLFQSSDNLVAGFYFIISFLVI